MPDSDDKPKPILKAPRIASSVATVEGKVRGWYSGPKTGKRTVVSPKPPPPPAAAAAGSMPVKSSAKLPPRAAELRPSSKATAIRDLVLGKPSQPPITDDKKDEEEKKGSIRKEDVKEAPTKKALEPTKPEAMPRKSDAAPLSLPHNDDDDKRADALETQAPESITTMEAAEVHKKDSEDTDTDESPPVEDATSRPINDLALESQAPLKDGDDDTPVPAEPETQPPSPEAAPAAEEPLLVPAGGLPDVRRSEKLRARKMAMPSRAMEQLEVSDSEDDDHEAQEEESVETASAPSTVMAAEERPKAARKSAEPLSSPRFTSAMAVARKSPVKRSSPHTSPVAARKPPTKRISRAAVVPKSSSPAKRKALAKKNSSTTTTANKKAKPTVAKSKPPTKRSSTSPTPKETPPPSEADPNDPFEFPQDDGAPDELALETQEDVPEPDPPKEAPQPKSSSGKKKKAAVVVSKQKATSKSPIGGPKLIWTGAPDDARDGGWPDGWTKKVFQRASGASKGHTDRYWFTPEKEYKLRSMVEVNKYLAHLEGCNGDEDAAWKKLKGKE